MQFNKKQSDTPATPRVHSNIIGMLLLWTFTFTAWVPVK